MKFTTSDYYLIEKNKCNKHVTDLGIISSRYHCICLQLLSVSMFDDDRVK